MSENDSLASQFTIALFAGSISIIWFDAFKLRKRREARYAKDNESKSSI